MNAVSRKQRVTAALQGYALARRRTLRLRALATVSLVLPPVGVNVGGGGGFAAWRWRNLDAAPGPGNPKPFRLTATARFPFTEKSVGTVYTSHCLEHLDDAAVARVLMEARRVVSARGRLVLKIPDFDRVLAAWRSDDETFLAAARWGHTRISTTWWRKGVPNTLDSRAAMIFCGFWNPSYGHHFEGVARRDATAYHGPAPMPPAQLQELKFGHSPNQISAAMREYVLAHETEPTFNHQNAWSRAELTALVERSGFRVITLDPAEVIAACRDVPGIDTMRDISSYCLARPDS